MQALNIEYRVGHILTKFNLFACCISEEEELELMALSLPLLKQRYRGYYMAARGYEFYLLVLLVSLTRSLHSLVRDTISTRR